MNDQPNDRLDEELCDDRALEQRLRRYYDARRAAGPTSGELRAGVVARLTAESAFSPPHASPDSSKETFVLTRRSDTRRAPDGAPSVRLPARRGGRGAGVAALLATAAVIALAALIFGSLRHAAPSHLGSPGHANAPDTSGWTKWTPNLPAGTPAAVYLDAGAHLHFVTFAGQDIAGPVLPRAGLITGNPPLPLDNASISPDGRRLAYIQAGNPNTGGTLAILDIASGTLTTTKVTALQVFWSPDSSTIAAESQVNTGTVWLVNAASGMGHPVSIEVNGARGGIGRLLAWTDSSHLAAIVSAGAPQGDSLSGGPQNLLGVIDLSSGQTRVIANLATPPDVFVSPDGAVALIAPDAANATAQLADLRSGAVTPLPSISAAFAGKLAELDNYNYAQGGNYSVHVAWQPGTHVLALSLRAIGYGPDPAGSSAQGSAAAPFASAQPTKQPAGIWLLNLDADTAAQITHNSYPLAWSADGQTLLLSSLPADGGASGAGAGVGSNIAALSPVAASGKQSQLASDMAAFLGIAM